MENIEDRKYEYDYRTLATSSVLTVLHIGVPSGKLLDREISAKVTVEAGANYDVVRTYKDIYSDSKELKGVEKYSQQVRSWHRALTLPFGDGGLRLLPEIRRASHSEKMSSCMIDWGEKKDLFEKTIPDLHASSNAKGVMGDLYNPLDYGSTEQVMRKFHFDWNYLPVPDSGHFIIDNANEAAGDLIDRFERHSEEGVNMAMQEAWDMLRRELRKVSNNCRLKEQREDGKASRFGPKNYEAALDLVDTLSSYNIVNDPDLEKARNDFSEVVKSTNADKIKNSDTEKVRIKDGVDSILDKFGL